MKNLVTRKATRPWSDLFIRSIPGYRDYILALQKSPSLHALVNGPLSTCLKMLGAANFKCAMHGDEQPFTVYDNSMNNNAESGAIIIAVSQRLFDGR